jgi:hypothetical protein
MSKIRALGDSVLFTFVDESKGGMFKPNLSKTILVATPLIDDQNTPRWGKVEAVGPKVVEKDIQPGKYILVDALQWTLGATIPDSDPEQKIWRTNEKSIALISDEQVSPY